MKASNFKVDEDGSSITATLVVRSSLGGKIFLYTLNVLLIGIIILFFIGNIGVITLFITVMEVLLFRYSLWNLYGSETVVLKKHSLSYQQRYGPIKMPAKTLNITKSLKVFPFHENFQTGNKAMKLVFESVDESLHPVNLYQTSLAISQQDYKSFMVAFNRLYKRKQDEYLLPLPQMN
ncbi:hypothetical protein [Pedobacter heparinus]|uniref:Uncharacterized protein n=1 Tax=Pedobacter heparinus (strain ATCC 13125 / DSM 2366 / CIP 104194 / JCM 7457 / NBRC 12017 / NCIMB 9290 / NRRL B-14731 / HIM 762-3) TaxID=485917 RepID=C6XZD2_PEDHD|nr:hypothetical protein [Pedobacter heparinus]ACU04628.1 hypothetical protein Phep_2424 [Pedobacter heparinus DSM 2366]